MSPTTFPLTIFFSIAIVAILFATGVAAGGNCGVVTFSNGSKCDMTGLDSSNFRFSGNLDQGQPYPGVHFWQISPCAPFVSSTAPGTECVGKYLGEGNDCTIVVSPLASQPTTSSNGRFMTASYGPTTDPSSGLKWSAIVSMHCAGDSSALNVASDYGAAVDGSNVHLTFNAYSRAFCAGAKNTNNGGGSSNWNGTKTSSVGFTLLDIALVIGGVTIATCLLLCIYRRLKQKQSSTAFSSNTLLLPVSHSGTNPTPYTTAPSPAPSPTYSTPGGGSSGFVPPPSPAKSPAAGKITKEPSASGQPKPELTQPTQQPAAPALPGQNDTAQMSLASLQKENVCDLSFTTAATAAAPRITVPANYAPPPSGNLASVLRSNKFLRSRFKYLDKIIDGAFAVAHATEKKQQQRTLAHPPLDLDECFTLALYSFDIGTGVPEDNFYFALNHALRHRDAAGSKELLEEALPPYFLVFDKAWAKLPPHQGRVFRGIPITGSVEKVKKEMKPGRVLSWNAVTSVTTDEKVADQFGRGTDSGVMFVVSAVDCRSIAEYSSLPQENELLCQPGTQLMVTPPPPGFAEASKNSLFVFVQQMQPESAPFTDGEKV